MMANIVSFVLILLAVGIGILLRLQFDLMSSDGGTLTLLQNHALLNLVV